MLLSYIFATLIGLSLWLVVRIREFSPFNLRDACSSVPRFIYVTFVRFDLTIDRLLLSSPVFVNLLNVLY